MVFFSQTPVLGNCALCPSKAMPVNKNLQTMLQTVETGLQTVLETVRTSWAKVTDRKFGIERVVMDNPLLLFYGL